MWNFIKNNPWDNFVENFTKEITRLQFFYFLIASLFIPTILILSSGLTWIKILVNLYALIGFFFLYKRFRSNRNYLNLHNKEKGKAFSFFYYISIKLGGLFASIFVFYLVVFIAMSILRVLTGIAQSEDPSKIPDYTTFKILFTSLTAGLSEEVWRFSFILLITLGLKKVFKNSWSKKSTQFTSLFIAIFISSYTFGWLHSFNHSDSYFSLPITIQIGTAGVFLALIAILTRRLWVVMFIHCWQDISALTVTLKLRKIGDISKITEKQFVHFFEQNHAFIMICFFLFLFTILMAILFFVFIRYSKGSNLNKL